MSAALGSVVTLALLGTSTALFQIPTLPGTKVNPQLRRLGDSQHGNELSFTIQVSEDRSFTWAEDPSYRPSFLAIKGLNVRLTDEPGKATMPGADGPRPHLSSGCCKVELLSPGSFTAMNGEVELDLDQDSACWEIIQREGAPAGQLLIGVDLKSKAERNSASLPPGRLFLNVAMWDPVVLTEHRQKLAVAEKAHREISQMKDKALEAMRMTGNPIMKALKFREACQAMEKLDLSPHRYLKEEVPEDGDEVLTNGFHIVKTGTLWQKNNAFLPRSEHQLLGTCSVKL
mmetsp:Transcript_70100/g.196174  ORF Transcript_70100/g.196174 Transcript_70100/m.196174 type:complete len:287 (-) Transcript_70100:555-1415(-)